MRIGEVSSQQGYTRSEAGEPLAGEFGHCVGEVDTDELRLQQAIEHRFGDEAGADAEIEYGSVSSGRRCKQIEDE